MNQCRPAETKTVFDNIASDWTRLNSQLVVAFGSFNLHGFFYILLWLHFFIFVLNYERDLHPFHNSTNVGTPSCHKLNSIQVAPWWEHLECIYLRTNLIVHMGCHISFCKILGPCFFVAIPLTKYTHSQKGYLLVALVLNPIHTMLWYCCVKTSSKCKGSIPDRKEWIPFLHTWKDLQAASRLKPIHFPINTSTYSKSIDLCQHAPWSDGTIVSRRHAHVHRCKPF